MSIPLRRTGLNRQTSFYFLCSQCLLCCRHKKIQINPYEVARLAANRGLSTSKFIDRYTHDSGTVLNWDEDGACVFLDAKGCGVHPDRPLVCRLYPLGRHVLASGDESFSEMEPDKDCKGVYSDNSMISAYLDSQGALPFMDAADKYLALLWRLCFILEKHAAEPENQKAIVSVLQNFAGGERNGDIGFADVDAIVAAFCGKLRRSIPKSIKDKILIHIQAVEAWAHNSERRQEHETKRTRKIAAKGSRKKSRDASH